MRSDLGELAAFAAVAEERGFTRAASRLGMSQSALSHSIRRLEKRLGLQLLARTTRSVSATAAGTGLLQELTPALQRIERSLAEARTKRESSRPNRGCRRAGIFQFPPDSPNASGSEGSCMHRLSL